MKTYNEVLQEIEYIENCDENIDMLKKAMEYYCSNHDICAGYKHALIMCITDQYNNHASEQDQEDLNKLSDILNGAL